MDVERTFAVSSVSTDIKRERSFYQRLPFNTRTLVLARAIVLMLCHSRCWALDGRVERSQLPA
jgi:hypothetical protein